MRKRILFVGLALGLLALGIGVTWRVLNVKRPIVSQPNTVGQSKQTVAVLNPLEIEAMRARKYISSDIVVEQDLGEQGGYRNLIVSYTSDGLKLYALMSRPDGGKPASGWPVVILEHGYIDPTQYRTDGAEYSSWIATLAKNGFMVIKPDYRGHGKSQGSAEGGHFSPAYAYDVLNLITSLKSYPDVNAAKIGQLGHSLGGHVALRVAVVSPDVKASIFAAGVVGSIEDILYNWPRSPMPYDQPMVALSQRRDQLIKMYGDPHENPDFWGRVSAVNYVRYVAGAVQIDHGAADTTVPKLFSDHLDAALKAAGRPDEYYVYEGGDHQFSAPGVRNLFLQRVIDFFDRSLKAG